MGVDDLIDIAVGILLPSRRRERAAFNAVGPVLSLFALAFAAMGAVLVAKGSLDGFPVMVLVPLVLTFVSGLLLLRGPAPSLLAGVISAALAFCGGAALHALTAFGEIAGAG